GPRPNGPQWDIRWHSGNRDFAQPGGRVLRPPGKRTDQPSRRQATLTYDGIVLPSREGFVHDFLTETAFSEERFLRLRSRLRERLRLRGGGNDDALRWDGVLGKGHLVFGVKA